ncbi:transposase family protein [Alteromonas sp. MB-3u-76]|uniref:transposase family protein n=1 Tax=Alteromonas sp. MB-3u-76 TaxID=2058133 RepID=UPI0012FD460E
MSRTLSQLKGPRIAGNQRRPLVNIITITLCAVICDYNDFFSIEGYGRFKEE